LALESGAQAEIPIMKRFNTIFDSIISLSPLFGLLGTVLGLITTFSSLKLGDATGTNAAGVTAGISEALNRVSGGNFYAFLCQYVSRVLLTADSFYSGSLRPVRAIVPSPLRTTTKRI
jgi:biopolymer transport protein ExbB/TolQ